MSHIFMCSFAIITRVKHTHTHILAIFPNGYFGLVLRYVTVDVPYANDQGRNPTGLIRTASN